jgi:hypothetical protein
MLVTGAIISVNCGLYDHVLFLTDEGTVIHNSKENGRVVEESALNALASKKIKSIRYLDWSTSQRAKVQGRARLGKKWAALDNCEHFVSEICSGEKVSPQLQFWTGVAIVGVVLAWIILKR